ncbi:MAG: CHASE2 domain-containing protein [Pseudomonadota bacterium]
MAVSGDAAGARPGWRETLSRLTALATARRVIGLLITLAVSLAVISGFRSVQSLVSLEAGLNDRLRVILSPYSQEQDPRISVLTITEDTLARFPYRSPVDRGFLAELIGLLGDAGVEAIALDILIDQPTEPEKDEALIQAIRDFDGALILAWADARAGLRPQQEAYLAEFAEKSGATPGFATVIYDDDGVVRRFDALREPGLPPGIPAALLQASGREIEPKKGLVDWRRETADGKTTFQEIPAHTLLNPALPKAMFRGWFGGRYVMIGANLEQTDRHQTSLAVDPFTSNRTAAGVILHAHVLSQLLDQRVVEDWNLRTPAGLAVGAAMALLGAAVGIASVSLLWRGAGLVALGAGYVALAVALAGQGGPYLPFAPPLLGLTVAFGLGGAAEAFLSSREKQFIRAAFSHYLEPAMVDRLAKDRSSLRLGGERREISFIFTDVAGFTDMSETLDPEALSELLNGYFDGIADIIARHNGSIDKFIGDAVVALFGALTDDPDHALNAIRCAAEMDEFAQRYRREMAHLGLGITRIGVHTGVASVGNFGGRRRFDYTAMGDAMNTAARLESVNKSLGTRVTVSAAAREAALRWSDPARPLPPLRPVGEVMLKGKAEAVEVFNLDAGTPEETREAYAEAWALLDSDPEGARARLEALAETQAGALDPLTQLHLVRLAAGETGTRLSG